MKTWIAITTAGAATVGPLLAFAVARSPVLRRGLPRWYLLPFGFERWGSGRCYRWLGVRWFKYWLPWSGDWIVRRMGKHPLRQGERQAMLDKAFQNTVLYELIHLFILLPLLPTIAMPFQRGAWKAGLFVVAVNLIVNVYPMMVQRYTRARLLPLVSEPVRQRWSRSPSSQPCQPWPERALKLLLRYGGSMSLLALVAVFMPQSWMDATHRALGMGPLPPEPIVGYLARSLSLFYAFQGGLLWLVSFQPRRHRSVLLFLGIAFILFGVVMAAVDFGVGMPGFWKYGEGPIVIVFGGMIYMLTAKLKSPPLDAG